jgi:hypothetical protein
MEGLFKEIFMSLKKVNFQENVINGRILEELKKIREAIKNGKTIKDSENSVHPSSPYASDRKTINQNQVLNSPEETKWKEVLTFDQMGYKQLIKLSSDDEHRKLIHDTIKKLNII